MPAIKQAVCLFLGAIMSTPTEHAVFHPQAARMDLPGIRSVTIARPLHWLRAGAQDMREAWPLSLFYGAVFALLGYGLVHGAGVKPHLAMALTSGFLFVAPVLATVFYCVSHRLEHHHKLPSLLVPLLAWRANPASLGLFALMLVSCYRFGSASRRSWSACSLTDPGSGVSPSC
jgi:uncharacterized membrane protein